MVCVSDFKSKQGPVWMFCPIFSYPKLPGPRISAALPSIMLKLPSPRYRATAVPLIFIVALSVPLFARLLHLSFDVCKVGKIHRVFGIEGERLMCVCVAWFSWQISA